MCECVKKIVFLNLHMAALTHKIRHSNKKKNGPDIFLPGGRDKIENTQTCRAAHTVMRERSRHTKKGQPSDIHSTKTRGTQHLTRSDGR